MADVETAAKKEEPVAAAGDQNKDAAKTKEESKVESLYAIYDVTARGAVKSLHDAAERGKVKDVTTFLNNMKNAKEVDGRDKVGRTALMWAVESGSVETVEKLLEAGAKLSIKEAHCGRTAVHLAARSGTLAVMKCVVESIKDKEDRNDMINQPDFNGATPVFLAKQRHSADAQQVFEYLLNQGSKY
ncbi:ankyrin repeat domain-containing protein [Chloropicon primus]|uniref:Ankyrin repeat domain-containing protein n=1 Tax=Chloropicon primus TaxID=1764295 RepID=A0A5B8MBA7_9CHLO|nr:ankyrin repeat domain-containing protein [Chloropicon primus]UPQ96757.1 ankyrin repeat domain-containing protein [Chloropicon primus]|eukprot:QDZ17539.1 ankyrin repeat domain-containing protein [Chloropicon primus]